MTGRVTVRVDGNPIPQGSKTRTPYGMRDDNAKVLKPWRRAVTAAAKDAARYRDEITGPVFVRITFTMDRPKAHYRTGRYAHLLRPDAPRFPIARGIGDLDKLVRSCFDALTDAHVWTDDVLVVDVRARRVFTGEHELALPNAGARIEIVPLVDQEALV